ncbi:FecR family protein [Galbibacter pacificus]|uniref:FecR domain-containing protein n=1 Tax=Galbibacter pacificus TaxID=2996052 RepID=A0ABT6FRK8_9FLAO|nr:FecR domain-containing protein [Galbibacter pacificus]MDG3581785.1 FecR domain-containing protein [Galbibacter pacificus]MDG3585741.1 FecR domain-containing protein [Galbibacter pacificus]
MKDKTFKKILSRYINGTASEGEKNIVEDFNRYFTEENKADIFDSVQHKKQVQSDIYKSIKRKITTKQANWYRIAASIVVTLGVGFSAWYSFYGPQKVLYTTVATSENEIKTIVLTDSSTVTLNHNSSLSFPQKFKSNKREVTLRGEAFFKISKDKNRPFTVAANNVTTTVLGTKFNVDMTAHRVSVSLVEGSVDVRGLGTSKVLKPKEQIEFNLTDSVVQTQIFDPKTTLLWMTNNLSFNNDRLLDIIKVLENKFKVAIKLQEPDLNEVRITGTFKGQSLTSILLAVTNTANLKFKKTTKNQILIFKTLPIDEK